MLSTIKENPVARDMSWWRWKPSNRHRVFHGNVIMENCVYPSEISSNFYRIKLSLWPVDKQSIWCDYDAHFRRIYKQNVPFQAYKRSPAQTLVEFCNRKTKSTLPSWNLLSIGAGPAITMCCVTRFKGSLINDDILMHVLLNRLTHHFSYRRGMTSFTWKHCGWEDLPSI